MGDISAYIATNYVYYGWIFLAIVFNALVFVQLMPSVSRVGGSAQIKAMKRLLVYRIDLASYRELEAFTKF